MPTREVAEIIGVSDRTMRRWRRCEKHGYDGLCDYRPAAEPAAALARLSQNPTRFHHDRPVNIGPEATYRLDEIIGWLAEAGEAPSMSESA
ncbi:MAG: helix-turn-helix domain-containing protein [Terriglobia bacterium]